MTFIALCLVVRALWRQAGYTFISVKNDFRTIYGPGVQKTDFTFEDE